MTSESHSLACQSINVRGRDLLLPVTAEVTPPKIISQNKDNIDRLRLLVRRLAKRHSLANDNGDHDRSNGPKMGELPNELNSKNNLSLKVGFDFMSQDLTGIKVVVTTANRGKTKHYQSCLLADFYKGSSGIQKGEFYFNLPAFYNANDILSVYLWNPANKKLQYDNFRVAIYKNQ